MDIGSGLAKIQGYEGAITVTPNPITGLGSLSTKRSYLYIPDNKDAIPEVDPIGFFHGYTLDYEKRLPNGQREQKYVVLTQGLVRDPNLDSASKIATAFLSAWITALDAHVSLEGTCTEQSVRGGSPTLTRLEWGGYTFIGFQLLLDVFMRDSTTVGA